MTNSTMARTLPGKGGGRDRAKEGGVGGRVPYLLRKAACYLTAALHPPPLAIMTINKGHWVNIMSTPPGWTCRSRQDREGVRVTVCGDGAAQSAKSSRIVMWDTGVKWPFTSTSDPPSKGWRWGRMTSPPPLRGAT